MVSAYNTPWVICTKYVLSNYFTTLGIKYQVPYQMNIVKNDRIPQDDIINNKGIIFASREV